MFLNWMLATVFLLLSVYQFLILPLWVLPIDLHWGYTLIPIALLSNTYWALLHETFHGIFYPSAKVNNLIGRVLAILFGAPFHLVRLGHLLHHSYNRSVRERIEIYNDQNISFFKASLLYYWQLLGGLYFLEFACTILFLLPRNFIQTLASNTSNSTSLLPLMASKLTRPKNLGNLRMDSVMILILFSFAIWAYGKNVWMFGLALGARAFFISFADYVYHYNTKINDTLSGKNLWLPKPLSAFLLNFNYHGTHHQNPQVGWHALPATYHLTEFKNDDKIVESFHHALLCQLKGPIPNSLINRQHIKPLTQHSAIDLV